MVAEGVGNCLVERQRLSLRLGFDEFGLLDDGRDARTLLPVNRV
jgi:hypothetical protein